MVDGDVLAFGENENGFLGTGGDSLRFEATAPVIFPDMESGEEILMISSGGHHTLALTSFSRVFSWGGNRYGQLGIGDNEDRYLPEILHHEMGIADKIFHER